MDAIRFTVSRRLNNRKCKVEPRTLKPVNFSFEIMTSSPCEVMKLLANKNLRLLAVFSPTNNKRPVYSVQKILEDKTPQTNTAKGEVFLEKWHDLLKKNMGYSPAEVEITCSNVLGASLCIIEGRHLNAAVRACEKRLAEFILSSVKKNNDMFWWFLYAKDLPLNWRKKMTKNLEKRSSLKLLKSILQSKKENIMINHHCQLVVRRKMRLAQKLEAYQLRKIVIYFDDSCTQKI